MVGKYKVQVCIKQNRSLAQKAFYSFHIHTSSHFIFGIEWTFFFLFLSMVEDVILYNT